MCTLIVDRSYETLGLIDTKSGKYRIYAAQDNDWFSKKEPEGDFDELTLHAASKLAYDEDTRNLLNDGKVCSIIHHLAQKPDESYAIVYRVKTRGGPIGGNEQNTVI